MAQILMLFVQVEKKTNKQTKTKNPAELDQIVYLKDVLTSELK